MIQVQKFWDGLSILYDGMVRQFLFTGEGEALLVDTGFAHSQVLAAVRTVTDAPVKVILTHADPDHAGGLGDFGEAWLHEKDWPLVKGDVKLHPLQEGDVFTCGDYRLETIEIPGHTYGSVAFVDWAKKLLLPGDSVQKEGPIYLFGAHRNVGLYVESERKLLDRAAEFETILPCHHACPIGPEWIGRNLEDAVALKAGQLPSTPEPGMPCWTYRGRWTQFYSTEEDIRR